MVQPPSAPGPGAPPSVPPAYPPPYPPTATMTAPYPPPPRKTNTILTVAVIVVVLVVALLAVVFYFLIVAPFRPITSRPSATFTPVAIANGAASFSVNTITAEWSPLFFLVNLRVSGVTGSPTSLFSPASVRVGSDTYAVTFTDNDADASVSVGDRFQVTRAGALPPSSTFTFLLLWTDQTAVGTVEWTTGTASRPVMTFS